MPETGEKDIRPSWVPLKKDPNFACSVMGGIDSAVNAVSEEKYNPVDNIRKFPLRKKPSPEELIKGVSEGDRKTFIRPSPAKGTLGGVARKSRETMLLCEAAGCDVILVETVGVGQSEITVRSMVDFFILVVLTGAGDDLQGIKKGIMEVADAIVVNKADGDNLPKAIVTQGEYERMIEFIRPATEGWKTHAYRCSALTKEGLLELWAVMRKFEKVTKECGSFDKRRKSQTISWVNSMIDEHLHNLFFEDPMIKGRLPAVMEAAVNGVVSPSQAVTELINAFDIDRASMRHRNQNK